jgi:hypothetical protein
LATTSQQVGAAVDGQPAAGGGAETPQRRRIDVRWAVGWLAGAWLVPVATHLLGIDWLLPPLVLALTAGLLRGGRTLLDRLMLAIAALIGAACAAGLIFTFWPFGFEPVAVAGTALTVLGAISVTTGRRPRLPRPAFTDGLTVAAALGAATYVGIPYLRTDSTGRFAMMLGGGEDHPRHVTIFDTIRRLGGYAFSQTPDQVPELYELLRYYPSGWHLTAGLIDGFVRSSTEVGSMTSAVDHYTYLVLAGYGLFALALIWAAQWIAGPLLGPWRLPLIAFLGIQLIYSDLPVMVIFGFPGQILGLSMLAILAAVLVRRPSGHREHMVIIGALLVAIGFGYELFLPSAFLAVAAWAIFRRRAVRPRLKFALAVGTVAGLLAIVPIVLGMLLGRHAKLLQQPGPVLPVSRALLVTLGLVLAAALVVLVVRRLRVWRSYLWVVAAVLALPVALQAYRIVTSNPVTYYWEKALHAVLLVALIGLGATVSFFPKTARLRFLGRRWIAAWIPAALVAAAVAVGSGTVLEDTPSRPGQAEQLARMWHSGRPVTASGPWAAQLMDVNRKYPPRPGELTIVLGDGFFQTYISTLYLSMLNRTSGLTDGVLYHGAGLWSDKPEDIADSLARPGVPIRLVVLSPNSDSVVEEIRRRKPQLELEVVRP